MSEGSKKATLVPLHYLSLELEQKLPIPISSAASVENVRGLLKERHFELWGEYLAKRDREAFEATRFALVHRYDGPEYGSNKEDTASQALLYKLFLLLRLLKPTRTRFSAVHIKTTDANEIEVSSFTHLTFTPPNVPDSERLNVITEDDLHRADEMSGHFLNVVDHGPANLRRAIRFYEEAYSDIRDPVLQIITWVMGIETACSDERGVVTQDQLLKRVSEYVPFDQDVYAGSVLKERHVVPELTVGAVISDVLELRNRLVHGLWIPQEWSEKVMYHSISGPAVIYADALRDAASYLLRRLIVGLIVSHQKSFDI